MLLKVESTCSEQTGMYQCWLSIRIFTPRAHAQSGVKQLVLSVCHQNLGLITTTKRLNTSGRHSNNDNLVHACMVYLKVAEAVLFTRISRYLWP